MPSPPFPVDQSTPTTTPPPPTTTATDSQQQRTLPTPFLTKTYQLVDDRSFDDLISWNDDGSTFIVWRPAEFARDLLPKYFKHNNFSSFVRQLNTYGFRKVVQDRWEFANDCFKRGEKTLLRDIQRRKISPTPITVVAPPPTLQHQPQPPLAVLRTVSPSNSGDEQVHSSSSSPSPSPSPSHGAMKVTVGRTTTEIIEQNEKLRRENMNLSEELNHLRGLCNNILTLMSNYAGGERESGGLTEDVRALDLLPKPAAVVDGENGGGGCRGGDEGVDVDADVDVCPRLFGVAIGGKRVRMEDEDDGHGSGGGSKGSGQDVDLHTQQQELSFSSGGS